MLDAEDTVLKGLWGYSRLGAVPQVRRNDRLQSTLTRLISGRFPLAAGGVRLVDESIDYESENALLLDPTRDDPDEHLCFHVKSSLGLVAPATRDGKASERGAMSIQVYGLNRLGLVQDRTRLLRRLEFLGELVIDLGLLIQDFENPAAQEPLRQAGLTHAGPTLRLMQDAMLHEMREMSACEAPYSAMASAWLEQFVERLAMAQI